MSLTACLAGCSFDPGGSAPSATGGDAAPMIDAAAGRGSIDAGRDVDAAAALDASLVALCEASCPGDCNESGACLVACGNGECDDEIVCPGGLPCHVLCAADDTCGAGVDCREASSCIIECLGNSTCSGPLQCGTGKCEITCDGDGSCKDGIDCSDSCACDVVCSGGSGNPCNPAASCPDGCDDDPGCSSSADDCTPTC